MVLTSGKMAKFDCLLSGGVCGRTFGEGRRLTVKDFFQKRKNSTLLWNETMKDVRRFPPR